MHSSAEQFRLGIERAEMMAAAAGATGSAARFSTRCVAAQVAIQVAEEVVFLKRFGRAFIE